MASSNSASPVAFSPSSSNQVSEYLYQMPIQGLLYIKHKRFDDERGFYSELNRVPEIEAATGKPFLVKQMNMSHSKSNVCRGLHAENWNKLLTVVCGSCFCAWADIRPTSATFGQVVTMEVGVESDHFGSVFVSAGIANSFCVNNGGVNYLYAVDALYADRDTSGDTAISLFDPDLNINWPVAKSDMIISDRDLSSISLREAFPEKFK